MLARKKNRIFLIHDYFVSVDGKIDMNGLVNLEIR